MDWKWIGVLAAGLSMVGCATQDIPQAHRGRIYGRTGFWALYQGEVGFNGPVLDPGTRFLGAYDEMRMLDCSMRTVTETFDTMTRDGVHFGFTLSVRFNADCSDESVVLMLGKLTPDKDDTISGKQIYGTFILPAIKEAAREFVSPYRANELNDKQAEVVTGVRRRFLEIMETRENHIVLIHEVNVGEMKFPPEMDNANLERAVQSVLKDKAIAELTAKTNSLEQYNCSWSIRLNNIQLPDGDRTDTYTVMHTVFDKALRPIFEGAKKRGLIPAIPDCDDILETAHILPAKASDRPKPIIARFYSRNMRAMVFRLKKELAPTTIITTKTGEKKTVHLYPIYEDLPSPPTSSCRTSSRTPGPVLCGP